MKKKISCNIMFNVHMQKLSKNYVNFFNRFYVNSNFVVCSDSLQNNDVFSKMILLLKRVFPNRYVSNIYTSITQTNWLI